jgi:hypothetical protein
MVKICGGGDVKSALCIGMDVNVSRSPVMRRWGCSGGSRKLSAPGTGVGVKPPEQVAVAICTSGDGLRSGVESGGGKVDEQAATAR